MKTFTAFRHLMLSVMLLFSWGALQAQYNFSSSGLQGINIYNPTSLDFGPDGRLYVSVQSGEIYAYTIFRNANNNYSVLYVEQIDLVKQIQNHNDNDGSLHNVIKRQITGITLAGTQA